MKFENLVEMTKLYVNGTNFKKTDIAGQSLNWKTLERSNQEYMATS